MGGKNKHPGCEARTSTVQARGPMAELPESAAEGLVAACLLRCRKDYSAAGAAMLHILRNFELHIRAPAAVVTCIFGFCWMREKIQFSNYFAGLLRWLFFGGLWFTSGLCLHAGVAWWGARTARGWPGGGGGIRGAMAGRKERSKHQRAQSGSREAVCRVHRVHGGLPRVLFFFSPSRPGIIPSARELLGFFFCPGIKLVPWRYLSVEIFRLVHRFVSGCLFYKDHSPKRILNNSQN